MREGVMRRRKKGFIKPIEITTRMGKEQEKMEAEEEPLSPGSVIFHRPGFNIHILAIMGCKTPINLEVLKAKAPITLLKHPRFSSLVVGDPSKEEELRWVRTEVDLDKHIIVPEIDTNKITSPDKFVEDYIYSLSKTTLDKSRPLWDVHILQLKTCNVEAEGIGIFRIHHSLGDGTSLITLLLALTRKISDPEAVPTIPVQREKISQNNSPKRLFWRGVLAIWWALKLLYNTMVDVMMFMATALFLKDTETPMKGGNGVALTPRRVVYKMVGLDDMKLVKSAMDATINDVALGITQAGLSRYLNRRYGVAVKNHGETLEKRNNLPEHIRIRSVLLINMRSSGGIQALADLMEKNAEAKWGNSIGYVLLPFTIGLRDDPLDYIREAKVTVDRKKHSLEALFTFSIAELVMKLLGTKVASALSHRINSHTTMCFSNLVGPLEEIGFYGHPIAFLAPSCYGQPHCRNSKRHCNHSRKKVEPEINEFVSAMAAGMNCQLIVEVTLSVSPITIALAAAARQTKGRHICILPEPFLTESSLFIKESGLAHFVDFVIGDPSEILARYNDIDFAVIDCRIVDYAELLKQLDVNLKKAVIVANNLSRGEKGLAENLKWVKDQKVSVKSLRHFMGKGMEVMMIGMRDDQSLHRKTLTSRGGHERFRSYNTMKRKSHWVKKVDEVSGEEHIFRVV